MAIVHHTATRAIGRENSKDDLYQALKPLLRFGGLIGFVPICGLFGRNGDLSIVHIGARRSPSRIISLVIIISLIIYAALFSLGFLIIGARDATGIIRSGSSIVFSYHGLFVCIFMFRNSNKLISCFHHWRQLSTSYYREDINLTGSVNLIAGVILTSGILENACSHWKVLAVLNKNVTLPWKSHTSSANSTTSVSILEIYWWFHHYEKFSYVVPYNFCLAAALFIFNKWSLYAWNFGDILISCMARAIYKRFQLNYTAAKENLQNIMDSHSFQEHNLAKGHQFWNNLVKDHEKLTDLLNTFNQTLSPLLFWSSTTNIFFLGWTLYNYFQSTNSSTMSSMTGGDGHFYFQNVDLSSYLLWHQIYVGWAFLQLLVRTYVTLVCCARVNVYAHKITRLLDKCPSQLWSRQVERMDFKLRTTTLGLTGLNFFTVTKPFLLKVVNVIVTFEIVLLQPKTF